MFICSYYGTIDKTYFKTMEWECCDREGRTVSLDNSQSSQSILNSRVSNMAMAMVMGDRTNMNCSTVRSRLGHNTDKDFFERDLLTVDCSGHLSDAIRQ